MAETSDIARQVDKHTPGPLTYNKPVIEVTVDGKRQTVASLTTLVRWDDTANGFTDCVPERDATGQLFAAAPDMLAALRNVNKLISEAAMTGFNYRDGDWPTRLFESQSVTSGAIRKAEGRGA